MSLASDYASEVLLKHSRKKVATAYNFELFDHRLIGCTKISSRIETVSLKQATSCSLINYSLETYAGGLRKVALL